MDQRFSNKYRKQTRAAFAEREKFKAVTPELQSKSLRVLDETVQNVGISKRIENAVLHSVTPAQRDLGTDTNRYTCNMRRIVWNLRHNAKLLDSVQKGVVTPEELAVMRPRALDPERWADVDAFLKQKELDREEAKRNLENETKGMFRCRNGQCRSYQTIYWQLQTRRGDEGMTTYVECTRCFARYKF